jgi:hypothetical protein
LAVPVGTVIHQATLRVGRMCSWPMRQAQDRQRSVSCGRTSKTRPVVGHCSRIFLSRIREDRGVCWWTTAIILVLRVTISTTVKGVCRNGRVVLLDAPEGVEGPEVVVTFPDAAGSPNSAKAASRVPNNA